MAWAFAGSAGLSGTQSGSGNTIATGAFSVSAGELIVVGFRWEGTAGDTITGSISDGGAGLTWSDVYYIGTSSGETQRQAVMWAVAESTGNLTLTWTFDSSAQRSYRTWHAHRYTFADGFTLADLSSAQSGTNLSAWTTGEYTVAAGDLAVVFLAHFNVNQQPQTPSDFNVGYDGGLYDSYYRIYAAGGDFSAGAGWVGGNESYAALALIFHEQSGAAPESAEVAGAGASSSDFNASVLALSQWDENSYALEFLNGGAVAAVILEPALSALSAYQEAAIASAGVSDTSPAEDGLSGRGVASVGIIDSASATDERSGRGIAVAGVDENTPAIDFPQTSSAIPVEFSSPSTGDEIVDAVADVNAYVLEGISAGEAWASSVLALAALVSSVSSGSGLSAASSSTLSRAVVENTPASSGFVSSVVALADLVSNGDAVSALLAAVVSTTTIAESATAGSAFSAGYFEASPASVTETALPASVVSAVAVVEASFAGISPSASALSAVAAVSVAWMSAGSAVAVFSALDRGAARYVLAAIQIRAILSASIEINPAANVVVEINPRS